MSLAEMTQRLGRTRHAVATKACDLQLGEQERGWLNMTELARISGFEPETLVRASKALGLKLRRGTACNGRRRPYRINETQARAITEWCLEHTQRSSSQILGEGNLYDACSICGRSGIKHAAQGVCTTCYGREWYRRKKAKTAARRVG